MIPIKHVKCELIMNATISKKILKWSITKITSSVDVSGQRLFDLVLITVKILQSIHFSVQTFKSDCNYKVLTRFILLKVRFLARRNVSHLKSHLYIWYMLSHSLYAFKTDSVIKRILLFLYSLLNHKWHRSRVSLIISVGLLIT